MKLMSHEGKIEVVGGQLVIPEGGLYQVTLFIKIDKSNYRDFFREAHWSEALELVAGRLSEYKEKEGPDSIGVLSSAKFTNEENYVVQKFARAVIGTNNVDHCARL